MLVPFLSPVGMRCPAYCSGCDKPSPGKSLGAVLAECRKTYITKRVVRPTPINLQKAALQGGFFFCTLPGLHPGPYRGWLASTGAQEQTAHKAFSEFWVQRHAAFYGDFTGCTGKFPFFPL